MNLFLRLLFTLIAARFRPACPAEGPCRTPFRVWLTDLDVVGHMNNGVYLSILDVARFDLLARSGVLGKLRAAGIFPVIAAETIRFRRPLWLFQRFDVVTQVIGRDDKAVLVGQVFVRRGGQKEVMTEAVIRIRFLRKRRRHRRPGGISAACSGRRPARVGAVDRGMEPHPGRQRATSLSFGG